MSVYKTLGRTPWFSRTFSYLRLFARTAKGLIGGKVSGAKMFRKTKEFGRDFKKPRFPSSSPLTPASQSCLYRRTCRGPPKPRGTEAIRRYGLVSVSGIRLQKRHSGPWSPRRVFGVSFLKLPIPGRPPQSRVGVRGGDIRFANGWPQPGEGTGFAGIPGPLS